ncbi:MAG: sodium:proton exchanger [Anaerocolumna sp.]|nr:sodium:proton exchanger [Anaerocolumna sp.]
MQFILLIFGLVLILKSADILIDSSAKIARKYGISSFIIGITVVAFGTSAPELVVGILSGIRGTNQLTLGNVIGSSLSNLALIAGLSSMILALIIKDSLVKKELPMLLLAEIILLVMMLCSSTMKRFYGILLLCGFIMFMLYIILEAKKSIPATFDVEGDLDTDNDGNGLNNEIMQKKEKSLLLLYVLTFLSLGGLIIGGKLTVDSSTLIATSFGLSQTLIGITIVSLATTMPELVTSIIAVIKKEPDIVMGNCIGSNLFNILFVLGISTTISPISIEKSLWIDLVITILLTIYIFIVSVIRKKLNRIDGILLFVTYLGFMTYKIFTVIF